MNGLAICGRVRLREALCAATLHLINVHLLVLFVNCVDDFHFCPLRPYHSLTSLSFPHPRMGAAADIGALLRAFEPLLRQRGEEVM